MDEASVKRYDVSSAQIQSYAEGRLLALLTLYGSSMITTVRLIKKWIPVLAAISKVLQPITNDVPPIKWVPRGLPASRSLVELALAGCLKGNATN